jgi:hypothetical protein
MRLRDAFLCALVGAGDAVEELHDVCGVGVGAVEGGRQEGLGERALLEVHPLGESRELLGVLGVE